MQVSILRLGYSLGALRLQLISYSKTLYWVTLLVKVNITLSLGLVESRPQKLVSSVSTVSEATFWQQQLKEQPRFSHVGFTLMCATVASSQHTQEDVSFV